MRRLVRLRVVVVLLRLAVVGLLVASLPGCSTVVPVRASAGHDETLRREIESIVSTALVERHIPGLSLVVLRGPEVLLARGYGVKELGRPGSMAPDTVLQLGSIGKQFLAALVLRMAEAGQLALDDPVRRHLPEFLGLPADLKLHHLLNHSAGIREPFTLAAYQHGIEDLARPAGDLVAILRSAPVDFPPGARWSYSNANYQLLALVVERISGLPYEDALAAGLFRPLGLSSMRQCTPLPLDGGEARGHLSRRGRLVAAAPENMNWIRGDGGLCGSATDVARWLRLLATGQVLAASSYRAMSSPTRLNDGSVADYGFALSLVPLDGRRKVAHNGAMLGFSASAAHYPDADLTIVVLTNRGAVATESIERAIARRVLGLPAPDWRERPIDAQQMRRYVGSYDIGVFAVQVVERAGRLWIEAPPPGPKAALRHLGDGLFAGDQDPDAVQLQFESRDGHVAGLRLLMGAMHWYGRPNLPRAAAD